MIIWLVNVGGGNGRPASKGFLWALFAIEVALLGAVLYAVLP